MRAQPVPQMKPVTRMYFLNTRNLLVSGVVMMGFLTEVFLREFISQ